MEKITCDTIINWLIEKVKNKEPISPFDYLDSAMKLNLLLQDEQEILYNFLQIVNQKKADLILADNSVAKAKVLIEASEEFKQYNIQKARIEMIIEHGRLAKKMSMVSNEELHNY